MSARIININTDRTDAFIYEKQCKLNQVVNFVEDKLSKLKEQLPVITYFLNDVNGIDLTIGNMYSTGTAEDSYVSGSSLIAHATFKIPKSYKNISLLEQKIVAAWEEYLKGVINIAYFKIDNIAIPEGNTVILGMEIKFQMWIK